MKTKSLYQLHLEDQLEALWSEFQTHWFPIGQDMKQKGFSVRDIAWEENEEWKRWSKERKQQ